MLSENIQVTRRMIAPYLLTLAADHPVDRTIIDDLITTLGEWARAARHAEAQIAALTAAPPEPAAAPVAGKPKLRVVSISEHNTGTSGNTGKDKP